MSDDKKPTTGGGLLATIKSAVPAAASGLAQTLKNGGKEVAAPAVKAPSALADLNIKIGSGLDFVVDATASRGPTWRQTLPHTVNVLQKFGGEGLQVALQTFGGDRLSERQVFVNSRNAVKTFEAVQAVEGSTQIVEAFNIVAELTTKPKLVVVIGDCFEARGGDTTENLQRVLSKFVLNGIKIAAFVDNSGGYNSDGNEAYKLMAERTGGIFRELGANFGPEVNALATWVAKGDEGLHELAQKDATARLIAKQLQLPPPAPRR